MKKKILIDASTLINKTDGLSTYILYLLKYLPDDFLLSFDVYVLINPDLKNEFFFEIAGNKKFTLIRYKIAPIGPRRDWNMFWFLLKWRKFFDLIHITSNTYPLALKGGICTVHDLTFKYYFDQPKYSLQLATTYMDMVLRHCLKSARKIVAVSQSTKKEIIKHYALNNAEQENITVIHEGWEHIRQKDKGIENTNDELQLPGNYIFCLGTFRKHKNISGLLLGFQLALPKIPSHVKLIVSGDQRHISADDIHIFNEINTNETRVIFTGYLYDSAVALHYQHADAYILPSLSEGFGFPILEAFYYNCPVLCSNVTSLPEIAGDAALFFNPQNPASIAEILIRFYSDPKLADELRMKGRKRLEKFSWVNTAHQTINLYQQYFDNGSLQGKLN